jgi:hypothetical protein
MASKSTNAQKEFRINQVMSMLTIGKYRWEILSDLSKEWKCSERNVEKYMAACTKLLRNHYSKETADDILAKYNYLYNDALVRGDKKLAKNVLDSMSKVGGYITDKIELSGQLSINTIRCVEIKKEDDLNDQ